LLRKHNVPVDFLTLDVALQLCHVKACALDFPRLLVADDLDFVRDILNIVRNIDFKTGSLGDAVTLIWFKDRQAVAAMG
jgi:hypothetical protein